jgi:hypothetical protein
VQVEGHQLRTDARRAQRGEDAAQVRGDCHAYRVGDAQLVHAQPQQPFGDRDHLARLHLAGVRAAEGRAQVGAHPHPALASSSHHRREGASDWR